MLDLETLGTNAGSVIISIGAVKFGGGKILDQFYERVDALSCETAGLRVELGAVLWWFKQSDEARLEVAREGKPIRQVLEWFSAWVGIPNPDPEIWGNGASFDNVVLAAAYDVLKLPRPWHFTKDRCYRTVRAMNQQVPFVRPADTKHNALDDARAQAIHLMEILKRIS